MLPTPDEDDHQREAHPKHQIVQQNFTLGCAEIWDSIYDF
jgi:hypothetical protein